MSVQVDERILSYSLPGVKRRLVVKWAISVYWDWARGTAIPEERSKLTIEDTEEICDDPSVMRAML